MYKFLVLAVVAVAFAQAGLIASPAVTSQSQNILRSWGNLGQVSTYSKTIDTPWSSVSKSDVRVSNPGLTSAIVGSPLLAQRTIVGSPLLAQRTIVGSPLLAQRTIVGSPLLAQRTIVGSPLLAQRTIVGSPLLAQRTIAAPAALIGTAYSAAPAVSHMTYVNSLGLQYGW